LTDCTSKVTFAAHDMAERVVASTAEHGLNVYMYYNEKPHLSRGWVLVELYLITYCQRFLHSEDPEVVDIVRRAIDPERLADVQAVFSAAHFMGISDSELVVRFLRDIYDRMPVAAEDTLGFEDFCTRGEIAWLRVGYIKRLAEQGGPFPRRQELPVGCFLIGVPPHGLRRFVTSHGWESEVHPSPSGAKMRRLTAELAVLKAADEDLVFLDFCSNTQEAKMGRLFKADEPFEGARARDATAAAYFAATGLAYISGRNFHQKRVFSYAMWEMGRLYSHKSCEVIVLPELDGLQSFPGGNVWGMVNDRAYENRGWCCAEFAIARKCDRIANLSNPAVQRVLACRRWPETVDDYAHMMSEDLPVDQRVEFTAKGDRAVVKYNFFKMAFGRAGLDFG